MPLVTLGLNHNSAPVDVRERVVLAENDMARALQALHAISGVREAAIISTCNRTEIYAMLAPETPAAVLQGWLEDTHRLEPDWLAPYLYIEQGSSAVSHLLRMASGLDSLILGEPQILGQTKLAHQSAQNAGALGQTLDRLFQHAFTVAKQVRTDTDIGLHPVSMAYAAVSLARQIFGDLPKRRALLIGAGEMIDLTARHLRELGCRAPLVANRSDARAARLAGHYGGEGIGLVDIPRRLHEVDIVVASTASNLPILGKGGVESALSRRRRRPMFMVDLAVPRDIEPEVGKLADVYLYTVDDLREVVDDNLRSRQAAAAQAAEIIEVQTAQFMQWLRSLEAVSAIREYRERAGETRDAVLERAQRRLRQGESADAVLEYLAQTLTAKLLHAPTVGLREAARSGDRSRVALARHMLGLDPDEDEDAP